MSEEVGESQQNVTTSTIQSEGDPIQEAMDAVGVKPYQHFVDGEWVGADSPQTFRSTSPEDLPHASYEAFEDPTTKKAAPEGEPSEEVKTTEEEQEAVPVEEPKEEPKAAEGTTPEEGTPEAPKEPEPAAEPESVPGMRASDWAKEFEAEHQKRLQAQAEKEQQAAPEAQRDSELLKEIGELKGRLDSIQNAKPSDPEDWLQAQLKKGGATEKQAEEGAVQVLREEIQNRFKELEAREQQIKDQAQQQQMETVRQKYFTELDELADRDERFHLVKVMGFADEAKKLATQAAVYGQFLTQEQALSSIQKGLSQEFQRIGSDEAARSAILKAMGVELPDPAQDPAPATAGSPTPSLSNNTGPAPVDEGSEDPYEHLSEHERLQKLAQGIRWIADE